MGAVRGTQRRIEKEEERGIGREADRKGKGIGLRESKEGEREREREEEREQPRGKPSGKKKERKRFNVNPFPGLFLGVAPFLFLRCRFHKKNWDINDTGAYNKQRTDAVWRAWMRANPLSWPFACIHLRHFFNRQFYPRVGDSRSTKNDSGKKVARPRRDEAAGRRLKRKTLQIYSSEIR